MSKKVVVVTVDTRGFVEKLLELGALGATLDNTCVVIKGIMMRAEVVLPDDAVVQENDTVRLSADSVAKIIESHNNKDEVDPNKTYTKEEMLEMTLKQVKDVTGLNYRSKDKMIAEYFGEKAEDDTDDSGAEKTKETENLTTPDEQEGVKEV